MKNLIFPQNFLWGSATAAHQVESMNIHSDIWAEEHVAGSIYKDKSDHTCDHYQHYREDIALMAGAGLKAYRFSIEWARIEPREGEFPAEAIAHYADVLAACEEHGITPVVTLHHFTSPQWLMKYGGWKGEKTPYYFGRYARYVLKSLGKHIPYIITLNEINIATMLKQLFAEWNFVPPIGMAAEGWTAPEWREQAAKACGTDIDHYFTIHMASEPEHIEIIRQAHNEAVKAAREFAPQAKVGVSLALADVCAAPGGEQVAEKVWQSYFGQYKDIYMNADFAAVQNYEREIYDANGRVPHGAEEELTECGYPYCPEAVSSVVRRVHKETGLPVMVTENGIATQDDSRRIDFIREAVTGLHAAVEDGVPLLGYIYWSSLDNLEWAMGFDKHFGLIAVDRETMHRTVKPSCRYLGRIAQNNGMTE